MGDEDAIFARLRGARLILKNSLSKQPVVNKFQNLIFFKLKMEHELAGNKLKETQKTIMVEEKVNLTLSKLNDSSIIGPNDCSKFLLSKVLRQKERKVRR